MDLRNLKLILNHTCLSRTRAPQLIWEYLTGPHFDFNRGENTNTLKGPRSLVITFTTPSGEPCAHDFECLVHETSLEEWTTFLTSKSIGQPVKSPMFFAGPTWLYLDEHITEFLPAEGHVDVIVTPSTTPKFDSLFTNMRIWEHLHMMMFNKRWTRRLGLYRLSVQHPKMPGVLEEWIGLSIGPSKTVSCVEGKQCSTYFVEGRAHCGCMFTVDSDLVKGSFVSFQHLENDLSEYLKTSVGEFAHAKYYTGNVFLKPGNVPKVTEIPGVGCIDWVEDVVVDPGHSVDWEASETPCIRAKAEAARPRM